jgi:hypothetical protein
MGISMKTPQACRDDLWAPVLADRRFRPNDFLVHVTELSRSDRQAGKGDLAQLAKGDPGLDAS